MAKASDFLKRRSEARVQSETIQSSDTTPLGKNEDGTVTRASDFLRKKAAERREIIDKEYGADAYGGSGRYEADKNAGFNSWLQEVSALSERLSSDHTDRQGAYQPADTFKKYRDDNDASIGVLQNRANSYRNYFTDNASLYDDAQIQNVMKALDEYSNYLSAAKGDLGNEYDYWAQFSDENAYNAAQEYNRKLEAFASAPSRPDAYTGDNLEGNLERVEALAALPQWSDAERAEAEEILKIWDSGDIRNGVSGWWSNLMYSITGNEEKYEGSFNTRLTNALRNKEISYDDYSRISTVYANLYNKVHKNSTALMMGLMEGTGALSLSKAIGTGLGSLMGDEAQGIMDSQYDYLDELSTYGQQTAPVAYAGGNIAGVLGLMTNIASGIGAIKGFSSLPAIAQSVISGAGALGGTTAIQGIGGAATGEQSWGDYALDVGGSAAAGAAGGAVSSGIGTWGTKFLQGKGLAGNMLARTVVAGLSGSGFVLGNAAVSQPAEYLRDPENYELEMDKLAVEALVGFAFSAFGYFTKNYTTDTASAAKVDEVDGWVKKYFGKMSPEEARAAYRSYAKQHADVLNYTGGTDTMTPEMLAKYRTLQQINAAWNRINANKGAAAYQAAQEAQTRGDTAAYEQAAADFQQSVGALQAAAAESGLATAETAQAAEILNTIAAGMAGGITSEAVSGAVPAVTEAPAAIETPTAPAAPATTAQEITATLVSAGVEPAEADSLGESMAALVNGEQISGNKAGAIAGNDAVLSVLEELTGEAINTAAPISEVKAAIRGLASPAEEAAQAPAPVDTTAQEMTVEDAAAAFNGGGKHDVINTAAVEQAPTRQAPEVSTEQTNIEVVADFAGTMERAGASALTKFYNPSQNPADYIQAMNAYYNSGKASPAAEFTTKTPANPLNLAQAEAAYLAGQADARSAETVVKTDGAVYTESESGGISALESRLGRYDEASVDGIKYSMRRSSDGKYFINIDRDTSVLGGRVTDARAHIYDDGPFDTREEAVQAILDMARNNNLTVKGAGKNEKGNNAAAVGKSPVPGETGRGALEKVAPEDVPGVGGGGDAVRDAGENRPVGIGSANRADAERDGRGRSLGDRKGSDLSAAGEVTAETPEQQAVSDAATEKIEQASTENPRGENFVIEGSLRLPSGEKSRFKANVDAIKLVKKLMQENRVATADEQLVLSKFVGWGGLSAAFDERKDDWSKEYKQLKDLLTAEEYKAARASTLNAHYTSVEVIQAMYEGLRGLGFNGGRMMEPSSGTGNFVGAMPQDMSGQVKSWTMVELDPITGNIAKYLYPNADVRVQGFEKALIPDNIMDVAIGNVPFGNFAIVDKSYPKETTGSIHNYFFAKSLDKVRPGGLVVFITSRYTLDGNGEAFRKYVADRADLLGAIRLPDTAFKGNAGTEVVTDIIILKKREPGTPYAGEEFLSASSKYIDGKYAGGVNDYFAKHPEMVLGTEALEGKMYSSNSLTYKALPGNLDTQIKRAFKKIKATMDYPVTPVRENVNLRAQEDAKKAKNGGFVAKDGKIFVQDNGELVPRELPDKEIKRVSGILSVRDTARELLQAQLTGRPEADTNALRKKLNKDYDEFVKAFGYLNGQTNARSIKDDPDFAFISALENYDKDSKTATKADIFSKNTVARNVTVTHVETIAEGLIVSINETGGVDLRRISELSGLTQEAISRQLMDAGLIFKTRDGGYETTEQYLSGNVKAKLRDAEALALIDKDYQKNVEELQKIIPQDIPYQAIHVTLGASWVPTEVYEMFGAHMTGSRYSSYSKPVTVSYASITGQFNVTASGAAKYTVDNTETWGTKDRSFLDIFKATLNNKSITVKRTDADGNEYVDKNATIAANEKATEVTKEFVRWVWEDEKRRDILANLYNEMFNNTVNPKYDGSNLTVDGANAEKPLRPHQKDVVHRIIMSGGNTLIAHEVGAGKTAEMAAAAMKLRQLGIVKKPVFVVPKSLVAQWGREFLDFFPSAKVLVAGETDTQKKNRRTFANRIATGDYDAVVISYENFKALPMSAETQATFLYEQITELEEAIAQAVSAGNRRDPSVKQMEKAKKSLEARIESLGDMKKDEDNIDFESLGVDSIFVDEAHSYKNLFYTTNMTNVSGLGDKKGSQRAFDLYMKVRWLQKINGGRGVVFATATPVMNSMSELYIMQKYLQYDLLKQRGLASFDAWANQFGEVRPVLEIKPSGKGYRQKESFSKFKNLPELFQMFHMFADVLTDVPGLKIPEAVRKTVVAQPSDFVLNYIDELEKRAEAVSKRSVDPSVDNMLKITSDGRKASYTQRMIDPSLPYEEGSKIELSANQVFATWQETKADRLTQVIFCDLATPKGEDKAKNVEGTDEAEGSTEEADNVSIYHDIKKMLVLKGIPASEIAFIHDANTQVKKAKLFDDMNAGRVRVLIGSTGKMGVGMNAQKKMIALHHLDSPWRPGDVKQQEGRILRQGNENDKAYIYTYVTEGTFDARMWDGLERKAKFINSIMSGNSDLREIEDIGEQALSFAEIKALASGNPLIMEQVEVSNEIQKLSAMKSEHANSVRRAKAKLKETIANIKSGEERIRNLEKDLSRREDTSGDKFSMTVGGKAFTERTKAGDAIIAAAKRVAKAPATESAVENIGSFAGFDIQVNSKGDLALIGELSYPATLNVESGGGTVQSLEAIVRSLETRLSGAKTMLEQNNADIKKLEALSEAPFEKQGRLSELIARNNEILATLNPKEENGPAIADEDSGAETDEEGGDEALIDRESTADTVAQEINSAKTSIKQIPALFKDKNVAFGKVNIDIGGGKFDLATEYLKSIGTLNLVFDPYNRSEAVNADTLNYLRGGYKADTATCANVLNVIKEADARANVILEVAKAVKADGKAYFMVYEGDGSGVGKETSAGWQNNRKTADYMEEIRKYFRGVSRKGKLIIAEEPKSKLPKASWEVSPGKGVLYNKDVTNDGAPHPERWTATRVGSKDKAPKPVSEIIAQIRHDFGLNVTYGHVRGTGVRGQFSPRDKGIRSRIANDLPTISHELGHALNDRYGILDDGITKGMHTELEKALGDLAAGYKPEQYDSEGLAEFLRQFLQNRETAAIDYPEFAQYFLGKLDGKDLALIEQLADDVNAYYSLDADTAESNIRLREEGGPDLRTHGEKIRQMGDEFYQAWIDANHGIKLFDEATGSSVYKLATNSAYSDAIAGRIITGDLTGSDGRYIGPGLRTALHGIDTRNKKEYKAFGEYLIVRHGPEYLAEGKRVFADDRKNSTAFMQRRQMELEQQYPQFEAAAMRLYQFVGDLNQAWGVDTQVISADQLAEWQQRWPNYVPFNRAISKTGRPGAKRGYANQNSPYKRAKGSGLDLVHPVDNIIDQIVLMVNVGVRNNVMYELRNAALGMGAEATFMEKVPTPMVPKSFDMTGIKEDLSKKIKDSDMEVDDMIRADKIIQSLNDVLLQFGRGRAHGDVVTVMVNGKPEFWKINDKLLLESVTSLSPAKLHGFMEAYAKTTRFMTANITGNNPVWSIFSNAPRDLATFAVYSKDKRPFKAAAAIGSGYINAFNERFRGGKGIDPLYAEYLAMGGGHTSAYSADTDLARNARKKLTSTTASKVLDAANPINWVSFISDTIEQGPRFATYKLMRQSGLSSQEAFYEAMDVTTNFRRGGYMARDVNKAVPFFNASVQGVDKFSRYFTAEDAPKGNRAKVVRNRWIAYTAASAILAALMYALNSWDDDHEKDYEQLSNYTKNSYWCIPLGDGKYFAIPKPREIAVMASFFETCMEQYIGGNEHAFDEFYDYATDNFLPSVVSDLVQLPSNIASSGVQQGLIDTTAGALGSAGLFGVGAYMVANRDFLGKPIESATMQYLEPKDRYNSTTSKMAYLMGQAFDLSPTMVDYFGNQVLGYLWKIPKALFPIGESADYSLGVRNSYIKDNAYSQDLINWLYDQADSSAMAKKSDSENTDKAITAKLDSSMTDFYANFNTLNKGKADTNERRHTRQVVLDMVNEYRKASESGETTAAQDAVYAVVRATGETSHMPSVMNTYVKDGSDMRHALTDDQYVTYQTRYLALYWNYAEQNLVNSMSTKEKAAVLQAAKDVAKEEATNAMLKRVGASETGYASTYDGVEAGSVIQFKAQIDLANEDGSLKQDEVIDILEIMVSDGLDYDDAYTLFRSRYNSDKNNPWKKYAPKK